VMSYAQYACCSRHHVVWIALPAEAQHMYATWQDSKEGNRGEVVIVMHSDM
jgi:hypothetical protein